MSVTINQKPHLSLVQVGQPILYSVIDTNVLANYVNVRYHATVRVVKGDFLNSTQQILSTLKTTPNASGYGIFDLRDVLETELYPDYTIDHTNSYTKCMGYTGQDTQGFPIHHLTKMSTSTGHGMVLMVEFEVRGALNSSAQIKKIGSGVQDSVRFITNNVPAANDILYQDVTTDNYYFYAGDYGMNYLPAATGNLATNMPERSAARMTDVGVTAFYQNLTIYHGNVSIDKIDFQFYDKDDVNLGDVGLSAQITNGGNSSQVGGVEYDSNKLFLYAGVYPGNLRQWTTIPAGTTYYSYRAKTGSSTNKSRKYWIDIIEECDRPFTRLTWLNKFGSWDYYNFTTKSVKTTTSEKKYFNAANGDWSGDRFTHTHYRGGKTAYNVNSMEKTTLHTDYLSESDAQWLESVITSPEVYIINEGNDWNDGEATPLKSDMRDLVEPVIVTNNSISRKTVMNEGLIEHTITIERNRKNNIHRI